MSSDQAAIAEHQSTPLLEHIDLYVDSLRAKGTNAGRVKTTKNRLRESASGSKFRRLSDLNLDKLESWLRKNISEKGRSASVYNGYVELWIAFGHWLAGKRMTGKSWHWNGDKRILANPFDGMGRLDTQQDRRRVARSLTEAELVKLLDAARHRPFREAMTVRRGPNKGKQVAKVSDDRRAKLEKLGIERALIYKTAVLTGLRANEMRTLRVSDLSFGDVPFVKLQSKNEKNRSGSTVPLRSDLASELKQWIDGRARDELVFTVPKGLLRIMNRDLVAAEIPKTDADGCVIHVHGLRTTFGTHLSAAGVAPRVAQAAMRHSDIKLTMGTYTDARLLDTAGAVESLPSLPRTVAPMVAPNLMDDSTLQATRDNGQEISVGAPIEKSTGESSVFAALLESG
jgi:integrase